MLFCVISTYSQVLAPKGIRVGECKQTKTLSVSIVDSNYKKPGSYATQYQLKKTFTRNEKLRA